MNELSVIDIDGKEYAVLDEIQNLFKVPFDKALEMCNNGEIIDSKTIIGITLRRQKTCTTSKCLTASLWRS